MSDRLVPQWVADELERFAERARFKRQYIAEFCALPPKWADERVTVKVVGADWNVDESQTVNGVHIRDTEGRP